MKCFYQQVMKRTGWMTMHVYELDDKIASLCEQGEKMAGQFMIQASDKNLPARNYSTKNLSTPGIRNARVGILAACTSETAFDLLLKHGNKGMTRRAIMSFCPPHELSVEDMIEDMYDENDELKENITTLDEPLESHRDFAFYKWMLKNPDSNDPGALYFRSEIPITHVGLLSDIKKYQRQYRRENPHDPNMEEIEYPHQWTDENNNLKASAFGVEDLYVKIKKQQMQFKSVLGTVGQIILASRHIKTFSLAWALTVRLKLLDIQNVNTEFRWDGKLDPSMCRIALEFVKIMDEYTYLLNCVQSKKSNYSSKNNSKAQSEALSQTNNTILECAFKKKVMEKIILFAQPTTTSSVVTRTLYSKKYKAFDNLQTIRHLVSIELPELFEIEHLNINNNRKYAVTITRKALSDVIRFFPNSEKQKLYMKLTTLGVTVLEWSQAFGTQEINWAASNKTLN